MKQILPVIAIFIFILASSPVKAANILLKGQLVTDDDQPVPATTIGVSGGPTGVTDDNGHFQINLSMDFLEGEQVIITVDKKGWLINHPLDGVWNLPNIKYQEVHTIRVKIVPLGSMKLWTHDRIEKLVAELNNELAKQKKPESGPKEVDFSFYLKEWADRYGFTPDQVKAQFDQWAEEVENSEDYRTLGLRAFYLKHFKKAAKYFTGAALKCNARAKEIQDAYWQAKKNEYENWKDAGNAYDAAYQFREALEAYRKAEEIASLEKFPRERVEIQVYIGNAQIELGIRVTGEESAVLLSAAVSTYRQVLRQYTRQDAPREWAMTQNNLGIALQDQGLRTGGAERAALLGQAVQAYQMALEVYTKEQLPQQWAMTQNNLGTVLQELGRRIRGAEGAVLLGRAVQAYQKALEVYTKEQLPQQWAATQNNLGAAFRNQGIRTNGAEGAALLGKAVQAYQKALEIRTKEQLPQDWAGTQNNLGIALQEQGLRTEGAEGAALLGRAVKAYQKALQVYTKEQLPQYWAMTQNNLGAALQDKGLRTGGAEGEALLDMAVQAYQKALEIRTFKYLPYAWANTQNNLAELYESRENWPAAIKHYRNVYKVYPDYAANKLAPLLHDRVFRFKESLEMNLYLVNRENDSYLNALSKLPENYFTAGLYTEGNRLITGLKPLLKGPAASHYLIILEVFAAGNWAGLDDPIKASVHLENLVRLVEKQPGDFKLDLKFPGSKYYIQTHPALEPHRNWLLSLFAALEKTGRDRIVAELKKIRPREHQSP